MIAERFGTHEQIAEMHSMLAEYHRKLAKEARLDIVHDYHADLAASGCGRRHWTRT